MKPSIVEVFEHYGLDIHGPDRGGWRKAQCPLPDHDDRTPSASVNEEMCRWRCHACDEGGDAYDLVMRFENVGFGAAKRLATELFGAGDGAVREQGGSSGLLPRRTRRDGRRGSFVPPWLR